MNYPKWVSRGHGLGEILCLSEDDEKAVHKDAADRKREAAKAEADRKKREAEEAEARAKAEAEAKKAQG